MKIYACPDLILLFPGSRTSDCFAPVKNPLVVDKAMI